jgi:hypothetical protein
MALVARQYLTLIAIRNTLNADTEIASEQSPWVAVKLNLHRGKTWEPGKYLSPLTPVDQPHENQMDRLVLRYLAAYMVPNEQALSDAQFEAQLAVIERVEDIFRRKGGRFAPSQLRNLTAAEPNNFSFQFTDCVPADRFIAAAWAAGYDASATIIQVHIDVPRRDVSTLGA